MLYRKFHVKSVVFCQTVWPKPPSQISLKRSLYVKNWRKPFLRPLFRATFPLNIDLNSSSVQLSLIDVFVNFQSKYQLVVPLNCNFACKLAPVTLDCPYMTAYPGLLHAVLHCGFVVSKSRKRALSVRGDSPVTTLRATSLLAPTAKTASSTIIFSYRRWKKKY